MMILFQKKKKAWIENNRYLSEVESDMELCVNVKKTRLVMLGNHVTWGDVLCSCFK